MSTSRLTRARADELTRLLFELDDQPREALQGLRSCAGRVAKEIPGRPEITVRALAMKSCHLEDVQRLTHALIRALRRVGAGLSASSKKHARATGRFPAGRGRRGRAFRR